MKDEDYLKFNVSLSKEKKHLLELMELTNEEKILKYLRHRYDLLDSAVIMIPKKEQNKEIK